jgi:hypothetical protein
MIQHITSFFGDIWAMYDIPPHHWRSTIARKWRYKLYFVAFYAIIVAANWSSNLFFCLSISTVLVLLFFGASSRLSYWSLINGHFHCIDCGSRCKLCMRCDEAVCTGCEAHSCRREVQG